MCNVDRLTLASELTSGIRFVLRTVVRYRIASSRLLNLHTFLSSSKCNACTRNGSLTSQEECSRDLLKSIKESVMCARLRAT